MTRSIEAKLGLVLRSGVLFSIAVLALGLALSLPATGRDPFSLLRSPAPALPHSLASIFNGVRQGRGAAVLSCGVLLLILTPVLRVASAAVLFARGRDRLYACLACTVFAILAVSFVIGVSGG